MMWAWVYTCCVIRYKLYPSRSPPPAPRPYTPQPLPPVDSLSSKEYHDTIQAFYTHRGARGDGTRSDGTGGVSRPDGGDGAGEDRGPQMSSASSVLSMLPPGSPAVGGTVSMSTAAGGGSAAAAVVAAGGSAAAGQASSVMGEAATDRQRVEVRYSQRPSHLGNIVYLGSLVIFSIQYIVSRRMLL